MHGARYVIGLIIAIVFGYLTLRNVAWTEILGAVSDLSNRYLALGVLTLGAGYCVRISRWRMMLGIFRPAISWRQAAGPFLASFALNNTIPFRAGDAVRAFAFRETLQVAPSRVVATLVLERLLDLVALIAFLLLGLIFVDMSLLPPQVETAIHIALGIALIGITFVIFMSRHIGLFMLFLSRSRLLHAVPAGPQIVKFMARALFSVGRMCAPIFLVKLLFLSILSWGFEGGVFWAVAAGLDLTNINVAPWFAMATGTLATLIPSTPGHVGTFDFFAKAGIMSFGVDGALATAHALVVHALLWIPITLAGGLFLLSTWGGAISVKTRHALQRENKAR